MIRSQGRRLIVNVNDLRKKNALRAVKYVLILTECLQTAL